MLRLRRKPGQTVEMLGGRIKLTVLKTGSGAVEIGFEAPQEINIRRGEVAEAIRLAVAAEQQAADAA